MPTSKKFYNSSMFQNSKEFTQLGTLAKDNRIAEYYQPDVPPQPKQLSNDIPDVKMPKQYMVGEDLR